MNIIYSCFYFAAAKQNKPQVDPGNIGQAWIDSWLYFEVNLDGLGSSQYCKVSAVLTNIYICED